MADKESDKIRVALVGDVALEFIAPYFREAGYEVYVPSGFGTWRQEWLDPSSGLNRFQPDFVYDVTSVDQWLKDEVEGFYDERMRRLASMPYSLAGLRAIVEEFEFVRLASGPVKKVLAVDADNTLWRGILSEDGMDALEPYREFQEALLAMRSRGVILVLLSKNDPFEFRADMPLERDSFTAVGVNWGPKAGNLIEICRALNVGTESVVFVDDNPHERAQMATQLPEVAVVSFPEDMTHPRQFIRRLETYFFPKQARTKEDALRNQDYAARGARASLAAGAATVDDYLEALKLRVVARRASAADLPRLVQMAGKTNQFNATTMRRGLDNFAAVMKDEGKKVFVFETSDKFGSQGIVCYVIVDERARRVTDFVMSCRAMGRTLENYVYDYVVRAVGFMPTLDFVRTAKNHPFEEFLKAIQAGQLKASHYQEGRQNGTQD